MYELPSTLTAGGRRSRTEDKAYALTRELLDLMKAEKANLAGATLAGIDDYREAWELSSIEEVARADVHPLPAAAADHRGPPA